MNTSAALWTFSPLVAETRAHRLGSYANYDEVIHLLLSQFKPAGFLWEPFRHERLKGCHRASFLIIVGREAYDAFFNSPAGYRGQYARSADAGEAANRQLLDALAQDLVAFAMDRSQINVSLLRASLSGADAKIWIDESEVEDHLGNDSIEIQFSRWESASEDGVGLRAPIGERLEIKGGWLDERGCEHRDPYKVGRSREIHDVGFS